jgi:branched-chain amino acid aminotransferase
MRTVQNGTIWVDGDITDWERARIPLMSDALLRSLCAFDALIAKRQAGGGLALLAPDRHLARLAETCRVLGLPIELSPGAILDGCRQVARREAEGYPEADVYVRPMIVGAALTPKVRSASVTIAAFRQDAVPAAPVSLKTSVWRRPDDDAMPAALKVTGNYQLSRLARREAAGLGYSEALLLNSGGHVAEAAGAAVVVERRGRLVTPPPWEDCLDSITVALLSSLARATGIELVREPVLLTHALSADGMALAGTLADLNRVERLDQVVFEDTATALLELQETYRAACRGGKGFDLLEALPV